MVCCNKSCYSCLRNGHSLCPACPACRERKHPDFRSAVCRNLRRKLPLEGAWDGGTACSDIFRYCRVCFPTQYSCSDGECRSFLSFRAWVRSFRRIRLRQLHFHYSGSLPIFCTSFQKNKIKLYLFFILVRKTNQEFIVFVKKQNFSLQDGDHIRIIRKKARKNRSALPLGQAHNNRSPKRKSRSDKMRRHKPKQ